MTIIVEPAQETRAKRRFNPSFRPDGGPLPNGNPEALPIDLKKQKDQSNTWESRQQRSTPNASFACLFPCRISGLAVFNCAHRSASLLQPVYTRFKNRSFPQI